MRRSGDEPYLPSVSTREDCVLLLLIDDKEVLLLLQQQDIQYSEVGDQRPFLTEGDTPLVLEKERDTVRSLTTYFFISLFILTVVMAFYVVVWRGSEWTQTKDLIELLLPAETALIGSAVGFYFGSKSLTSDKS